MEGKKYVVSLVHDLRSNAIMFKIVHKPITYIHMGTHIHEHTRNVIYIFPVPYF